MHLLNLPPELLQSIFDYSSVTNCLQTAYTCRTLFEVLSNYRKGILYQLSQLPSPPSGTLGTSNATHNSSNTNSNSDDDDLGSKSTAELSILLRRRAAQNLCGANFHANQSIYTFGEGAPIIDTLASTIRPGHGGDPNVALVQKGVPRVYLYFVSGGQVVPRGVLEPVVVWPGKVEVLKVVFGEEGDMISVLQRFTPLPEGGGVDENKAASGNANANGNASVDGAAGSKHIFEEEAMKPYRKESTQLVHYRRRKPGSRYSRVTISAFPGQDEYRPLAIAVANRHLVAISWQHKQHLDRSMVIVHGAYPDAPTEDMKIAYQVYNDNTIIDEDGTMPYDNRYQRPRNTGSIEPIIQMRFNDNASQLLYYHPSSTIYGHFQRIELEYGSTTTTSGLLRNSCWVKYYNTDSASDFGDAVKFTIAIPFFSTHETHSHDPTRELCYWKYLALGTATDKHGELIACILMSEAHCRSSNCQHTENLDRGRRLDNWRVVARLAGYSTSVNSLPGIVAASPRATRLAIANWKTITVWPMDPHAIIERNAAGVYPENMIDVDVTGAVLLEPVVLESEAVCFMLRFAEGEDEIISLTDRGVIRWEIGAGSMGRREVSVLGIEDGVGVDGEESEEEGEEKEKEKRKGLDMGVDMDDEDISVSEDDGEGENGNEVNVDEDEQDYDVDDDDEDVEMDDDDVMRI
ncbi:hypothetical protein AJ78_08132 [Emergomyces pasteurianus Ep9510]|uniref:F-box domain-containing protein n=1 Tax=Emergomyces pasteurianus Ep9510 TaxID=1447872 RepID=A0A1J9P564_9EURO|nr:hypothetical protein AJ78_08132 [Emergomyces pasteurianus Ep9510]